MTEENKKHEEKTEEKQELTADLVNKTIDAANRIEEANAKQEKLLLQQQEFYAKQRLAGKSIGPQQVEPKKELTDKEYKDYFLKHGKPPAED